MSAAQPGKRNQAGCDREHHHARHHTFDGLRLDPFQGIASVAQAEQRVDTESQEAAAGQRHEKRPPIDLGRPGAEHEHAERKRRRQQIERRQRHRAPLQPPLDAGQPSLRRVMPESRLAKLSARPVRERGAGERAQRRQQRREPDECGAAACQRHDRRIDAERQREEESGIEKAEHEHARQRQKKLDECVNHRSVLMSATAITAAMAMIR